MEDGHEPASNEEASSEPPTIDVESLSPGAQIVVNGRRLTLAMVVPRRSGYDLAPTCGAPVFFDPATDGPIEPQ